MAIKDTWDGLSPNVKRWAAPMAGLAAIGLLVFLAGPDQGDRRSRYSEDLIENVLTDANTKKIGIQTVSAKVDALEERQLEIVAGLDKLTAKLDETAGKSFAVGVERQMKQIRDELARTRSDLDTAQKKFAAEIKDLQRNGVQASASAKKEGEADARVQPASMTTAPPPSSAPTGTDSVFSQAPPPAAPGLPAGAGGPEEGGNGRTMVRTMKIREVAQPVDERDTVDKKKIAVLPAGSIISGTLITGMDAPTGQAARRDPFPSLLRVKADAILPNFNTADIRECFILMSGWGDLSSERAYLRGENISCVSTSGAVFEAGLKGFAVGEDGKHGVRGRLVSKQGQMIGRAMLAGFMEGMAGAFDVNPVPTLNLSGNGSDLGQQPYQQVMSAQTLQSSAMKGAGSAMERVAQFYVDLAEELFPVVEVSPGRKIDMILNGSLRLDFNKQNQAATVGVLAAGAESGTNPQAPNLPKIRRPGAGG